ncbi:MAG: hypothetical protein JWN13_5159 [Betaproteobacteria bacterium]|jgi:hypothetical protein|nr:hypothetical protein [Betaproteobacteria bacterium]
MPMSTATRKFAIERDAMSARLSRALPRAISALRKRNDAQPYVAADALKRAAVPEFIGMSLAYCPPRRAACGLQPVALPRVCQRLSQ